MLRPYLVIALALAASGCGGDDSGGDVLGGSLTVTGSVYDFHDTAPISGTASIATTALSPPPRITVEGSDFTIDGVPENSAFQVLASVAPTHRSTYSPAVEVIDSDVDGVRALAVSETFLGTLASGFGITPSAAKGILLMRLADAQNAPKSGVMASNIVLANAAGAMGPFFLQTNLSPATGANATTTSGWVVFFEVPPGVISLGQAATATVTLAMASSPVGAGAVTITDVAVTDGAPQPVPTNVSFAQTVVPIFETRGCVACHSGSGPGKDLGGLTLDGGTNLIHRELTEENPARAKTTNPETSLVLTMPSAESPSDGHPNVTFTGPQDPDYLKILGWLREGAKQN